MKVILPDTNILLGFYTSPIIEALIRRRADYGSIDDLKAEHIRKATVEHQTRYDWLFNSKEHKTVITEGVADQVRWFTRQLQQEIDLRSYQFTREELGGRRNGQMVHDREVFAALTEYSETLRMKKRPLHANTRKTPAIHAYHTLERYVADITHRFGEFKDHEWDNHTDDDLATLALWEGIRYNKQVAVLTNDTEVQMRVLLFKHLIAKQLPLYPGSKTLQNMIERTPKVMYWESTQNTPSDSSRMAKAEEWARIHRGHAPPNGDQGRRQNYDFFMKDNAKFLNQATERLLRDFDRMLEPKALPEHRTVA